MQHIALSSRDIFASAEAFAAAGFPVLAISPNYYDDLAARFELDDALLDRLRRLNILYDQDANAEFFQFYGPIPRPGVLLRNR